MVKCLIIFHASKSLYIQVAKNLFIAHTFPFGKWKLADVQGYSVFGLKRVLNFTLHTFFFSLRMISKHFDSISLRQISHGEKNLDKHIETGFVYSTLRIKKHSSLLTPGP